MSQAITRTRCTIKLVTSKGKNLDISLGKGVSIDAIRRVILKAVEHAEGDEGVLQYHVGGGG